MQPALTRSVLQFLIVSGLLLAAGPLSAQPAPPVEKDRAQQKAVSSATLTVWNRPIVVFRAPVRQMSPAARAAGAAQRIVALPDDVRADEIRADLTTIGDLQGMLVTARNVALFGILAEDLDPTTGETLEEVSRRAVGELRAVLQARAEQRRPRVILRGVVLSVGAAAALAVVLWAIERMTHRALARLAQVTHRRATSLLGLDLKPFVNATERGLVRLTAWGLALIAAYLWLTFALHEFPYTRPWSDRLSGYLLDLLRDLGTGALHAIPGLFAVVVIFLAARLVVRGVDVFFQAVEKDVVKLRALQPDTARATRRIMAVLIWIFALTVAYEYIPGSQTDAFKAVGVLTGLMLSLGSAGLINHVMSGLVVVYSRALRPGELVQTGDIVGLVSEVGLLSTKLVTAKREEITVPNAVLASSTVTNYSRLAGADGAIISASVTIGYDQPWRQVHTLLLLAAERTPGVRKEPKPYVLQTALSDFFVKYEVRAHLDQAAVRFRVLSDLNAQIQDAFNEFGVQIMSPAFESQPERAVVVPKARWYTAPAAPPKDETSTKETR